MPRFAAVTALVVLLLLSGCTAFESFSATSTPVETPTATKSPSSTPSATKSPSSSVTTYGYNCPYILTVNRATEDLVAQVNGTVAYDELSAARQQEFRAAVAEIENESSGSVELGTELPSVWSSPRIVEYRGEQYYTVTAVC